MRLYLNENEYIDTNEPLDLSIGLQAGEGNLRAWYVNPPTFEPVRANGFIGSVKEGGGVNFRDVFFNPHGHGTHTECHGHITPEVVSVNQKLRTYFFKARLISVQPEILDNEPFNIEFISSVISKLIFSFPNSKCWISIMNKSE